MGDCQVLPSQQHQNTVTSASRVADNASCTLRGIARGQLPWQAPMARTAVSTGKPSLVCFAGSERKCLFIVLLDSWKCRVYACFRMMRLLSRTWLRDRIGEHLQLGGEPRSVPEVQQLRGSAHERPII